MYYVEFIDCLYEIRFIKIDFYGNCVNFKFLEDCVGK